MRVERLKFKVGIDAASPPLSVEPQRVTVFIGPNNGGKSASLRELHHSLTTGQDLNRIFSEIAHEQLTEEQIQDAIKHFTIDGIQATGPGKSVFGYRGDRQEFNSDQVRKFMKYKDPENGGRQSIHAYGIILRHYTLNLSGENRLGLAGGGGAQNLRETPQSTIAALFLDNVLRHRVSSIVHDAFGQYLVIDPTTMGSLNYALSESNPSDEIARSFGDEALKFYSTCSPLMQASDGTRAFVGIIIEVIAGQHDILIIDEPEAFLHPALAYLLGREVAKNLEEGKQLFVSTHSPHFLMGCMSVGAPVDIIRLTYRAKQATARLLPSTELRRMMIDPLLKSIGVVGALFFESAVVVEADSDRAFYEEINSRLNLFGAGGLRHTAFLNAHNKQEAAHIARVLRNIGIPAAMVLDLDWIKEDGKVAQRYFAAAGIPAGLRSGLLEMRRTVRASLEAVGEDYRSTGGIGRLEGAARATAVSFFDQTARFGLFTVRRGELEQWLPHLNVNARKDQWLQKIFEALGSDVSQADYVKPSDDDVWEMMRDVGSWVSNNAREGMQYVDPAEL